MSTNHPPLCPSAEELTHDDQEAPMLTCLYMATGTELAEPPPQWQTAFAERNMRLHTSDTLTEAAQAAIVYGFPTALRKQVHEARGYCTTTAIVVAAPRNPEVERLAFRLGVQDWLDIKSSPEQIAVAVERSIWRQAFCTRQLSTVENWSKTDSLCGVLNRRGLEGGLDLLQRLNTRSLERLHAIVIDCDRFKAINDAYGHAAGDNVLAQLAERLRQNVRVSDLVARVGGDEFMVILAPCATAIARGVAEKLRQAIAGTPFAYNSKLIPMTASLAVGYLPRKVRTATDILARLSVAQKHAKTTGRNRIAWTRSQRSLCAEG